MPNRIALGAAAFILALVSAPAGAQGPTELAGTLSGTVTFLGPGIPQPFSFEGEANLGGLFDGSPAVGSYACTASGLGGGVVGPISGEYSCTAAQALGGAPQTASGTFAGFSSLGMVHFEGTFEGRELVCDGQAVPNYFERNYPLAMACEISG